MYKTNPASYARMVEALLVVGDQSQHDLAEFTGLSMGTLRYHIRALLARKVIYVSSWAPDSMGRIVFPCYSFDPTQMRKPAPKKGVTAEQYNSSRKARSHYHKMSHLLSGRPGPVPPVLTPRLKETSK